MQSPNLSQPIIATFTRLTRRIALSAVFGGIPLLAGCNVDTVGPGALQPSTSTPVIPTWVVRSTGNVDPDSRARYVISNKVDVGGTMVAAGIVGDGRLRDGSSAAGGDSEFQGDMCGVAGTITNGPREAGDLIYDPNSGPTAPCGAARFYVFNLDGVPTQTAPLSRVFGIWSLDVGASVSQAQGFGVQLTNCAVLSFDSQYGGDNLLITRLDNGSGARQWQVKSQGGHLAACVNLSKKGAANYIATGKKYYLPFAITVTEIPRV